MSAPSLLITIGAAYSVTGATVSLLHPRLVREQLKELRNLDLGRAGWLLKPAMGLLVLILCSALWPLAWRNAGKSDRLRAEQQAAQLERLRPFWHLRAAMSAPVRYAGGDGSSFEQAIVIIGGTIFSGPSAEYAYLERRFPGYLHCEQQVRENKGRTFDVHLMTVQGEKIVVFFDISGHLAKAQ